MTDLRDFYLASIGPQIVALEVALERLKNGAGEGADSIGRVAHQLKGSGASYGFAEVTDRAVEVLGSSGSDLMVATQSLIELLNELSGDAVVSRQMVVVVDDDPVMQVLVGNSIEASGREILVASTMTEGRQHLTSKVDMLILDIFLPDGDGRQLLTELKQDPTTADMLVIVLSGADGDVARAECLALGADAFLGKPFEPESLSTLVDSLLRADSGRRRRATASTSLAAKSAEAPAARGPRSILLAEDDKLVAALIVDRLSRDGFTIVHCADGEAALAEAKQNPPDLVLLDVKMPKMDGFEVLGHLRESVVLSEVPVLILTAMGGEQDVVRGFDLGADDYVLKPFSPSELAARVQRLMPAS